jgi:phage/plasmid-associated DNA primase
VLAATDEYFEAEDALGRWIEECCAQGPAFSETTAPLFASWKAWAEAGGEYVGSIKRFSQTLTARGFERCRAAGSPPRGFRGIALKPRQPGITDMEF